jgi:hypothetical protein
MDAQTAPLGALIISVGQSVAGAQATIDRRVLEHFSLIYDQSIVAFEPLRAIGYQPTWYQVSEATAQIVLALTVARSQAGTGSTDARPPRVHAAPVDAGYQSRFGYRRESASSLKFRIVPVPPPPAVAGLPVAPDVASLPGTDEPGA